MSNLDPIWSQERVQTLKKLCDAGLTAAQIAKDLNTGVVEFYFVSRNAVIGKVKREGFQLQSKKGGSGGGKRKQTNQNPSGESSIKIIPPLEPLKPKVEIVVLEPKNISFFDLDEKQCRWVTKEEGKSQFYCGHEVVFRKSYCTGHAGIVSAPYKKKKK